MLRYTLHSFSNYNKKEAANFTDQAETIEILWLARGTSLSQKLLEVNSCALLLVRSVSLTSREATREALEHISAWEI